MLFSIKIYNFCFLS